MKVADAVACALPLITDATGASPYWFAGTCVLVRRGNAIYIVTAPSCLGDGVPERVCVPSAPDGQASEIVVESMFRPAVGRRADADWIVFGVQAQVPARGHLWPLDLDAIADAVLPHASDAKMLIRGFRRSPGAITAEEQRQWWPARDATGGYIGRTKGASHLHDALLDHAGAFVSIDSMMGSPAFVVEERRDGMHATLAGLVVGSDAQRGVVHFLDGRVVRAAVDEVHRRASETL